MSEKITIDDYKGIKNDTNSKQVSMDYFYDIVNFNFEDTSVCGLEKVLCPERTLQIDNAQIDGIYEYRFLDENNILQTQYIVVCNGKIYKTDLTSYATQIHSGMQTGKVSFAVYQDKLFITNGKDNVLVYYGQYGLISQMGAPLAIEGESGYLTGNYQYQVTFVTNGGEEVVGTTSNRIYITGKSVKLILPIGYDGVTSRKIYRTKNGTNDYYLVTTINNNTATTFTDNLIDMFLTTAIPDVNNEMPKPYFLQCAGGKLYGGKCDKYPTQLFATGTYIELFDSASYIDVSNFGDDNTPIEAVAEDFNKVVVGTNKNIFFINTSDNSVTLTRANVGVLDGYSVAKCPSFNNFAGGLMFISTKYDVRLMSGQQALPVATSLDNISTVNYAQNIQGTFPNDVKGYDTICSTYFNYKYMLQIDNIRYVFDIRNSAWTKQQIKTDNYESLPTSLAIINNELINGQKDGSIEFEYRNVQYREEDCRAYLQSAEINAQSDFTFIEKMYFWFTSSEDNDLKISFVSDDNTSYIKEKEFRCIDGAYNSDFLITDFERNERGMDYKVYNIYKPCRWFKYKLEVNSGSITLEKFEISGQKISNKE